MLKVKAMARYRKIECPIQPIGVTKRQNPWYIKSAALYFGP